MGHHRVPVQPQPVQIWGLTIVPASRQQYTVLSSQGARLARCLPVASVPQLSGSVASTKTLHSTVDNLGPPGSAPLGTGNAGRLGSQRMEGPSSCFPPLDGKRKRFSFHASRTVLLRPDASCLASCICSGNRAKWDVIPLRAVWYCKG